MLGVYVSVPVACFRKGLAREYLETEPLPPPAMCYGFLLSLVGEIDRRRHVGCRVAPVLLSKPPTSVVLRTVWRCKVENYWKAPDGRVYILGSSEMKKLNEWVRATLTARVVNIIPPADIKKLFEDEASEEKLSQILVPVEWSNLVLTWLAGREDPPKVSGKKASDFLKSQKELKAALDRWMKESDEFVVGLGCGENARPDYQQLLTNVELLIWLDSSGEGRSDRLEDRVKAALTPPVGSAIRSRFGGLSLGESTHLVDEVKPFAPDPGRTGRAFLEHPRGRLTLPVWVDHVGSAGTRYVTGNLEEGPLTPPAAERVPRISPD